MVHRLSNCVLAIVLACQSLTVAETDETTDRIEFESVPPSERLVGIAYTTWHRRLPWQKVWGKPELGYYRSDDRTVIRRHADWLEQAGVDFIWIDWSNGVNYIPGVSNPHSGHAFIERSTGVVFEEYAKMERSPKIAIFVGVTLHPEAASDGRLQRKADQVYDDYLAKPEYRSLYQHYLGKPLLVVYVHTPSPWQHGTPDWDDDRFTVRYMTGYVSEQPSLRTPDRVSKYGYWSWEDRGQQTFPIHEGRPEAMVITAAQRQQFGRDGRNAIPAVGRKNGETFRKQWDRAGRSAPSLRWSFPGMNGSAVNNPALRSARTLNHQRNLGDSTWTC